jgi:hypothetical protein
MGTSSRFRACWLRLGIPVVEIVEALTSPTERSIELRQNSPFAGLLAPERRQAILEAFRNQGSDDAS